MNLGKTILILLFLTGCATARYDLVINAQHSSFSEPINNQNPNAALAETEYISKGPGLQIGIMETTHILFTEFGGFYNNSGTNQVEIYNGTMPSQVELKDSRYGFYGKLGINLWWFRPYYTVQGLSTNYESNNQALLDELNSDIAAISGWGLGFIYPYSERISIYAGYEALKAKESRSRFEGFGFVTEQTSYNYASTFSLGITIYLGTLQGLGKEDETISWP